MRQKGGLLLAGVLACPYALVAASVPRGVSPEFAKFFADKSKFSCINHPSIVLEASRVNDGSCDCPDGSDEPGTAACAFIDPLSPIQPLPGSASGTTSTTPALPGFWCTNAGHIGAYVPFSYVNDGICDYDLCCDGSEEYAKKGGVKCENRCVAIGKEYRRMEEKRKKAQEKAAAQRHVLAQEAAKLRHELVARVLRYKDELVALEAKRDALEAKLAEVRRTQRGKVVRSGRNKTAVGGKLGVLLSLAKNRVEELRDTLDEVLDQRDDLQDKVNELETILRNFKSQYNPNFNDEGVKAAVHAWDDYAAKTAPEKSDKAQDTDIHAILKEDSEENGINWKEFETDDATDTDILYSFEAYLPGFVREFVHRQLDSLRAWLIQNGILADNSGSEESPAVASARQDLQNAETDVSNLRSSLAADETELSADYGKGDIFRALKDKCVSVEAGEYDYELCWMAQATQKSKKGHGDTSLGRFERIDVEEADDEERQDGKSLGRGPRMVLRYENGQGCWNGPNRRSDVWLGCAEKEEVWRVSEAEKCVYRMEVGTPAACEEGPVSGASGKDEL